METYFNIRYEFDRDAVEHAIKLRLPKPGSDYNCVADGVILDHANRDDEYLKIVNGGMFAICDSSYVPVYLKWIYGISRRQYCGSEIFRDIVLSRKYRMIFLGTSQKILDALRENLIRMNPDVKDMVFAELPFCKVDEFDYPAIAKTIADNHADIIWVALGAPKQECFMARLKPHLDHGVMIAVGAAFKFFSGIDANRAPEWMVRNHMEFVYRIYSEPKKQMRRCSKIITSLPRLLIQEYKRSKQIQ